jgi:membrane peptidoglycan carboxypeptidase
MKQVSTIVHRREARRTRIQAAGRLPRFLAGLAAAAAILAGGLATVGAVVISNLAEDLPPVRTIERRFTTAGMHDFATTRLFERNGSGLLAEAIHPRAGERRWLRVDPSALARPQVDFVRALLAYQGPDFAADPGYDAEELLAAILGASTRLSISEQLARATLTPLADVERSPVAQRLRIAMQAAELTRTYSKAQILEWYLNCADFGHLAYGVDAAALVYFGKHANDLSLAESAMLAGIPGRPDANPFDAPAAAQARQLEVLLTMEARGWITRTQLDEAQHTALALADPGVGDFPDEPALVGAAWVQLGEVWGDAITSRPGLRILTSMDADLQAQATCTAGTHLARLAGGDASAVAPASGGACVAAGLLPPLRPATAQGESGAPSASVVLLEPGTGEVLALVGQAMAARPAGPALAPLTYLTAFSRGYSPASMVIIPATPSADAATEASEPNGTPQTSIGMMRMRTALANGFAGAAEKTWSLAGGANVLRTARQMGVDVAGNGEAGPGALEASLLDLTQAYAVFDTLGRMTGIPVGPAAGGGGLPDLAPSMIVRIDDAATGESFVPQGETRSVLSAQLAYLVSDVLSDEEARWPSYHQGNALEIGRPAGVQAGSSPQAGDSWTIGYTPEMVIGVRVGGEGEAAVEAEDGLTGAAPIWHALMRYASRDAEPSGWVTPPGIETVDVCDPSGLLPTEYCPQVVKEVFLPGAAPTQYDNIYRPFRINRETGKLATLSTPIELIEERVFLIPPPEAEAWARQIGIPQPPTEYDTVASGSTASGDVMIDTPAAFSYVHNRVEVTGSVDVKDLKFYRLQAGQGLDPIRWIQIGEDFPTAVENGLLATWDTDKVNGLYTLQLIAVHQDGQLETASVQVSVDNTLPEVRIVSPTAGQPEARLGTQVVLQVDASDNLGLAKVELLLDGSPLMEFTQPPYSIRWTPESAGRVELAARATDLAGNLAEAPPLEIRVTP